jgi:hypothetical protein
VFHGAREQGKFVSPGQLIVATVEMLLDRDATEDDRLKPAIAEKLNVEQQGGLLYARPVGFVTPEIAKEAEAFTAMMAEVREEG